MPVIIKRYQNRKLYNTETKKYITLNQIEDLIKKHYAIKVIDNQTGNDITALTLSQIIFEVEKNNSSFLPIKVLLSLVLSGGKKIEEIRQNIFNSLNLIHHYDVEIERRINILVETGELTEEDGNTILSKLLRIDSQININSVDEDKLVLNTDWNNSVPSSIDIHKLIKQVDDMSRKMDYYSSSHSQIS